MADRPDMVAAAATAPAAEVLINPLRVSFICSFSISFRFIATLLCEKNKGDYRAETQRRREKHMEEAKAFHQDEGGYPPFAPVFPLPSSLKF
jgi:hypothetical protein